MRRGRVGEPITLTALAAGASAATGIFNTVLSVFKGIGDKSPNYPIKSANTERKLKQEVADNIPAPTSVANALELIEKAKQLKEANLKRDNSKRVIDSIRMMYDEAIAILQGYINANGGIAAANAASNAPGPGGSAAVAPGGAAVPQKSFIEKNLLLLLAAGGVGVYLLTRNKRRR